MTTTMSNAAATSADKTKIHDDARLFIKVLVNYLTPDNYNEISQKYTLNNDLVKIINDPEVRLYAKTHFKCSNDTEITQRIIDTIRYQIINSGMCDKCLYLLYPYDTSVSYFNYDSSYTDDPNIARLRNRGYHEKEKNLGYVKLYLEHIDDIDQSDYIADAMSFKLYGKYNSSLKCWQFDILLLLENIHYLLGDGFDNKDLTAFSYIKPNQKEKIYNLRNNYNKWAWLSEILERTRLKKIIEQQNNNH